MEKIQGYTRYSKSKASASDSTETEKELGGAPTFEESAIPHQPAKELSFLHDVPLSLSAELGRCKITIRKLLGLVPGSILTLADEPQVQVSVRANGNEIARGEVVTVNDHFGVRITEVVSGREDE